MFKIISCGWQCAQFMEQTIQSVLHQKRQDWEMQIIYDLSDDGGEDILWAMDRKDRRIRVMCNDQQNYAAHNQWEALQMLDPDYDDIVIWLDLDGDQLAHPYVLDRLAKAYEDPEVLLTYGSYRAKVSKEPPRILPIPEDVVKSNTYRDDARFNGIRVNHLRTMKGRVAKSIPVESFKWPDGNWYMSGQDYVFMISGLERVAGRYVVIPDVLMVYNDDNPLNDNKVHGQETHQCDLDFMSRPPLHRLT
jgi:Glycosyl transferase family 2